MHSFISGGLVAQEDGLVRAKAADDFQHRVEGFAVGMDVGQDGDAHLASVRPSLRTADSHALRRLRIVRRQTTFMRVTADKKVDTVAYPLPTNGILVAITVMNSTLESSGRPDM